MLEIQIYITEINYILKYIQIENSYFKLKYYFTILQFLLYFFNQMNAAPVNWNVTMFFYYYVFCISTILVSGIIAMF